MLSSSSKKRHGVVTPYSVVSNLEGRRSPPLQQYTTTPAPHQQHDRHDSPGGPVNLLARLQTPMPTALMDMFTFSPFGLCCRRPECRTRPQIEPTERSIQIHLKKHAKSTDDYRLPIVVKILGSFHEEVEKARASGNIDEYRQNNEEYTCFTCICGRTFPNKKQNVVRHCKKTGCDLTKIHNESAIKLRCGRYVTQSQVAAFFRNNAPYINQQFDYDLARRVLEPFLLEIEKNDHVYTPMYLPLIMQCGGDTMFASKIKRDFIMIHSPPDPIGECLLITIHERAEKWLCYYCQKNILMVPGNLRAGLQTFEGGEVNEVNQKTTYTMQHNPTSLVSEVKKLLSFAYRRGLFSQRGFDCRNDFEVARFLKDLLLEIPGSVCSHPFVVEFCLMYSFRVKKNSDEITMISCDAVSSVFSKVASACKAGVCSVICSISADALTVHGPNLVQAVRGSPVLHILSPMVRQIREMAARIPKRRKTTLDSNGNITVDQFSFSFDDWSCIVPRSIEIMKSALSRLANGVWWEPVVDISSTVTVCVDEVTRDLHLEGLNQDWKKTLPLDDLDSLTATLEMAFHGFGGGAARMTELERPTMFHCLYSNDAIYYTLESIKVYNHSSRKHKEVERKLPPIISRYYLLFRMLVQSHQDLFEPENLTLLLPSRKDRSTVGVSHVIRDLFTLGSLPDMIQVRQFWAGVSNYVTGGAETDLLYLTSDDVGAEKMGHSMVTHAIKYSSQRIGIDESHFNKYHAAIGDTSYNKKNTQERLSLSHIRLAMESRYPHSGPSVVLGTKYLSLGQKELVEFGYGGSDDCNQHCLGLLPPGEGKSETYLIPTIARRMANQQPRMIIHVSPYSFLAAYQYSSAGAAMVKLNLRDVSIRCLTGSDITVGGLPEALQSKENLPHLLFLNVDAMHHLFELYVEDLKTWKPFIDKIVIDEVHTIFSELTFRDKYSVYHCLPALGVPIVALSGSIPSFAVSKLAQRIGLSVFEDSHDLKVIKGGDVVGNFPKGFRISAVLQDTYLSKVINFVIRCLGAQPIPKHAIHVFVSEKGEGRKIHEELKSRFNCRFVSSENSTVEVNDVATAWSRGEFNVLISTSIALVGNENPKCRYLACAGYFYDRMQLVQAFGRLRKYMRRGGGAVFFAAPTNLPAFREKEDRHRFTRLCNENFISVQQFDLFQITMTSKGVRDWLIDASVGGDTGCALKKLSLSFGQKRENCGACLSCRSQPKRNLQEAAEQRMAQERRNSQLTHRLLQKLTIQCLCCRRADCRGIPILKGVGSKHLPENRGLCFSWKMCMRCGVSTHDRKTACFDKSYLNQFACCECWVYKNVQGWERHEMNNCPVMGRLRRLLSHNYLQSKVTVTYKEYIEAIYTSTLTFCQFMAEMEVKYNKNNK